MILNPKSILSNLESVNFRLKQIEDALDDVLNRYDKLNPEALTIARELNRIKKATDRLWEKL